MEVLKAAGLEIENTVDFGLRIDICVPLKYVNIIIACKQLQVVAEKMRSTNNLHVPKLTYSNLTSIPFQQILQNLSFYFKGIYDVLHDCFFLYQHENKSLEPFFEYQSLNSLLELSIITIKNRKRRREESGGDKILLFLENCQSMIKKKKISDVDFIISTSNKEPQRQRRIKKSYARKLLGSLNEDVKNSTSPLKIVRQDEFFINPFLYDWKQRSKWKNSHPLHQSDSQQLLNFIMHVEILSSPGPPKELIHLCQEWTQFINILNIFVGAEANVAKNSGYNRILKHHLKGSIVNAAVLNPISKKVIFLYISDILRRVLPASLFEAIRLRKKFIKNLKKVIYCNKDEGLLLLPFLECFSPQPKWLLQIPPFFKKALCLKLIKFVIVDYVLNILRNQFYITETGSTGFELYFYRKGEFERECCNTLKILIDSRALEVAKEDSVCLERSWLNGNIINTEICKENLLPKSREYALPAAKIRFLPKRPGSNQLRILTITPNLKYSPYTKLLRQRKRARDIKLKLVKRWITCLIDKIGTGIRPLPSEPKLTEAWERVSALRNKTGLKLYYVKADIADAFGSVCYEKILTLLDRLTPNAGNSAMHEFTIKEWAISQGNLAKHSRQSFSRKLKGNVLLHSRRTCNREPYPITFFKNIIKQILCGQMLTFGRKCYHLSRGLAQGGVGLLSPLLCELYFSMLDRQCFKTFLYDKQSVFLRAVDDYLFISANKEACAAFYRMVLDGFLDFHTYFKTEKLVTNLNENEASFTYLGLNFNINSLLVWSDYKKYNIGIINTIKLSDINQTKYFNKSSFLEKKLNAVSSLKIVKIIFQSRTDAPHRIRKTIFGTCFVQAMKALALAKHLYINLTQLVPILMSVPMRVFKLVRRHSSYLTLKEIDYMFWQCLFIVGRKYAGYLPGLCTVIKFKIVAICRSIESSDVNFLNSVIDAILGARKHLRW